MCSALDVASVNVKRPAKTLNVSGAFLYLLFGLFMPEADSLKHPAAIVSNPLLQRKFSEPDPFH